MFPSDEDVVKLNMHLIAIHIFYTELNASSQSYMSLVDDPCRGHGNKGAVLVLQCRAS